MNPTPRPNAPPAGDVKRRDFIHGTVAAGRGGRRRAGAFYFGYDRAVGSPVRVGVIGTGDEGSVLLGAINPEFIEVKAIADIRPYNVWRAFHGDYSTEAAADGPAGPDGEVRLEDRRARPGGTSRSTAATRN